jgi:hypothetical protein
VPRDAVECSTGGVEQTEHIRSVVTRLGRDELLGLCGSESKVFKVGQAIRTFGKFEVFAALRCDAFDLLDRRPQFVGFAGTAVTLGDEHIQLALRALPARVDLLVVAEHDGESAARKPVECLALGGRGPKSDLF